MRSYLTFACWVLLSAPAWANDVNTSASATEQPAPKPATASAVANEQLVDAEQETPAQKERAQAIRVAVYDFELSDVDPQVGRIVTDSVLAELRKLQRVSVIGMEEVQAMLDHEAQKQLMGCESDESCLADIAGALGVDVLVTGSLARLNDAHIFTMKRIDQTKAKVAGTVNRRLKAGTGEEFLAAIGPAVETLFPDFPLRQGRKRGVPQEVALRLNPPPLQPWVFWSALGTAAVATSISAMLGGLSAFFYTDYQRYLERGKTERLDGPTLTAKAALTNRTSVAALTTLGVSATLWAATGVTALFVDWQGYGDGGEE